MPLNEVKLFTKKDEEIIGVKLVDDSFGEIKYTIDSITANKTCTLPSRVLETQKGYYIFALSSGKKVECFLDDILDYSEKYWFRSVG